MKVSYHLAKFGGHRHSGSVDINVFSLSCDLDMMTPSAPACLVSLNSISVDVPAFQIWSS